jgi:hypothetical protein
MEERFPSSKAVAVALCGDLEMELAQLPESEAAELRASYGLPEESALNRVIRTSSQLAGLAHFFTVGPDEVRAWTIPAQSPAVSAARVIHSDLERGFIRAEVIPWDTLLECGSLTVARQRGLLRSEGRDYRVQDGDVMHVLFNVGRWEDFMYASLVERSWICIPICYEFWRHEERESFLRDKDIDPDTALVANMFLTKAFSVSSTSCAATATVSFVTIRFVTAAANMWIGGITWAIRFKKNRQSSRLSSCCPVVRNLCDVEVPLTESEV